MENQNKGTTQVLDISQMPTLKTLEQLYINLVLEKTNGNKAETAKILGLSVKTIYNKLDSYKAEPTNTVG
jgi:DNA-binding NtrC family response regulator